jgi:hypothetical protein
MDRLVRILLPPQKTEENLAQKNPDVVATIDPKGGVIRVQYK